MPNIGDIIKSQSKEVDPITKECVSKWTRQATM